jgi:hypothetical protein
MPGIAPEAHHRRVTSSRHSAPPEKTIGDADLEFELAEVPCTPSSSSLPWKPAGASSELEAELQSMPKKHADDLKP